VHVLNLVILGALICALVFLVLILVRQRYILRASGSLAMAVARGTGRWQYGIARVDDDVLRWYRALGLGTRPSKVWGRDAMTIIGHRQLTSSEMTALPGPSIAVRCRIERTTSTGRSSRELEFAFTDGAYTGFVSWLESARSPRM
jgi:hypothetical protein